MDEHYGERRLALAAPMRGFPGLKSVSRDSDDSVNVLAGFSGGVEAFACLANKAWKPP